MPPTFNYRSEWKKMRGPWGINWNTMISKEGDAPPQAAPMPVAVQDTRAVAPRQAPRLDPFAAMDQYSGIMDSQIAELDALDAGDGGRAYNQGMIEASKSISEAAQAKAMAQYLHGLTPIDYASPVNYPVRPERAPMTPFVAPQVDINPWAAGFAALAGLVDPRAAAPATHSLLDATVNRQEVVRQQAQQAWQAALADQNQRYEDSLAGYGQDVARATSARELALKSAIAQRNAEIQQKQLEVQGANPAIDVATQTAIDTAGKAAARREAILAGIKATQARYDTEAKRAALQMTEAGKTERTSMLAGSARGLAELRQDGAVTLARLNNAADMQQLLAREDAQAAITREEIASRERVAQVAAQASMYGADTRGAGNNRLSGSQEAMADSLKKQYEQAASNYRTVMGSSDLSWSGTIKAQAAAMLREMVAKEKAYTDFVTGLQTPAQASPGQIRVTFPTPRAGGGVGGGGNPKPKPKPKPKPGGGSAKMQAFIDALMK